MNDSKYAVGQVWSYRTRPAESESRLYIVRTTQSDKLGTIYSIFLDGLLIKNARLEGGVQSSLPHAPVSAATLDASVTVLIETLQTDLPDISEGYEIWREAFESGEGGVFTIPVHEVVKYIEDAAAGTLGG